MNKLAEYDRKSNRACTAKIQMHGTNVANAAENHHYSHVSVKNQRKSVFMINCISLVNINIYQSDMRNNRILLSHWSFQPLSACPEQKQKSIIILLLNCRPVVKTWQGNTGVYSELWFNMSSVCAGGQWKQDQDHMSSKPLQLCQT